MHLAAATQLRSLAIEHSLTDQEPFTCGREAKALLGLALSRLSAVTSLSLSGVCRRSVPDRVGAMSALQVRWAGLVGLLVAMEWVGMLLEVCLAQRGWHVPRGCISPQALNACAQLCDCAHPYPPGLHRSDVQKLDITFSEGVPDLPAGPFHSSLTELHSDWGLAEAALRAGPGHALWHLPQLRVLDAIEWSTSDTSADDKVAFRAAAAERMPGLQKLNI